MKKPIRFSRHAGAARALPGQLLALVVLACSGSTTGVPDADHAGTGGTGAGPSQSSGGNSAAGGAAGASGQATGSGGAGGGTGGTPGGGSGGVAPHVAGTGGGPASGGSGGSAASGGAAGGGAAGQPASGGAPGKSCHDASNDWVPEVKACKVDADCTAIPTYGCCGPGPVYGLAKAAQETYPACFVVSHPANCPPLGCASQASTEDGQQVGYNTDLVVTRCVDVAGGARACYTTAKGACSHNVTRCVAGDTCANECGAPCKCQNGYMNCALPSGSCAAQQNIIPGCRYPSAPAAASATYCQCSLDTHTWMCQS